MQPPRRPALLAAFCFALLLPPASAARPSPASGEEVYELPKMEVKDTAVCSFGIGVVATWDRATQKVTHLYVSGVSPGSAAEELGLARGDEILSINGRKVSELKGSFKHGSDFFNLLVNQPPGREIKLEVAVRTVKPVTLTALPYLP